MSRSDELSHIRREVEAIRTRVHDISCRLYAIETAESMKQAGEEDLPPPIPAQTPRPSAALGKHYRESVRPATVPFEPKPTTILKTAYSEKPPPAKKAENPLMKMLRERLEESRAKRRELGWELSIGTYWIPRIAILLIIIAVVFALSMAIKQWAGLYMPHIRVGIGYLVCAGMLGLAKRFEGRFETYARALYAGGYGLIYFVTYATHFIPFSRIFQTPGPTLVLLAAIAVAWLAAAQIRRSKTIAYLATVLGHFTILLSSVELDVATPSSAVGILFLSAGSAFFLLRNRWYYVAALGLAGSYINYMVFLANCPVSGLLLNFILSMSILAAFFFIYALAELYSPTPVRRDEIPTWFRSGFVTLNSTFFFAIGSTLVQNFDFAREHHDIFRFSYAAVLLVIALLYLLRRERDPLYNVYITKAVVILSLGLSARYSGNSLTTWLAVETVVLLVAAQRSGLIVTRVLAFGVAVVAFDHLLPATLEDTRFVGYATEGYAIRLAQYLAVALSFLAASLLYQRVDWAKRSPRTAPFSSNTRLLFWQMDLIAEAPESKTSLFPLKKPLGGLFFPTLYALMGLVALLLPLQSIASKGHMFVASAGGALLLLIAAILLRSKPFGLVSILLLVAATIFGGSEIFREETVSVSVALAGLLAVAVSALSTEAFFKPRDPDCLAWQRKPQSPYLYYGAFAGLLGLLLLREIGPFSQTMALEGVAIGFAALFLVLRPRPQAWICISLILWSGLAWAVDSTATYNNSMPHWRLALFSIVAISMAAHHFFLYFTRRADVRVAMMLVHAWFFLTLYPIVEQEIGMEWKLAAVCLVQFAFLFHGLLFRSKTSATVSAFGMLITSGIVCLYTMNPRAFSALSPLAMSYLLPVIYWIFSERLLTAAKDKAQNKLWSKATGGLVVLITFMMLVMLYQVPSVVPVNKVFVTIAWFILSVTLFALSFATRQKYYRYAALTVILISLSRVFFIDMRNTNTILRVAAFAVLGVGLLAIGYGYFKWMERLKVSTEEESEEA